MKLFNKKTAALLTAILLCGGAMFAHSAQPAADKNIKPLFNDSGVLDSNRPNLGAGPHVTSGSPELFFKMMLTVLLVVALGSAAIYISKRVFPKFARLPAKRIRIVETVNLGPRKSVHLLKIGNQLLLIGSTNENITKLSDVTEEPPETEVSAT